MSATAITYTPSVVCINDGPKDKVRVHSGMCQVGLYMTFAGFEARGDWLLREVISLWQGTEQFDAEIALVQPLLERFALNGLDVPVTAEEGHALRVLCTEAEEYFRTNDYEHTYDNREEYLLGVASVSGLALCTMPHDVVEMRTALPVGLHEKPYRWVRDYRMIKEYG